MNNFFNKVFKNRLRIFYYVFCLFLLYIVLSFSNGNERFFSILSPFASNSLNPLNEDQLKGGYEVFGFAPHWTFDKLDNVDFSVLSTLAYFGIEVNQDGSIVKDAGYNVFHSQEATALFTKAHENGTRVVLTLTQMQNDKIKSFLDDPEAQENIISEAVSLVSERGIDGINIDFEYTGNPGSEYKDKFSVFTKNLAEKMHKENPESHVSVSVYASSVNSPQLYDLEKLSRYSDGIFMMAYDFATSGSGHAIPTAPLYGHKDGEYWYDISTAVEDFLRVMPKEKLILGLPWYGYDYPVKNPSVKASRDYGYYARAYNRWGYPYSYFVPRGKAYAQTYAKAKDIEHIEQEGWDENGQVGWKAYKDDSGQWRMIFLEDERSLAIKYDFAKEKGLKGVGMWALGFDHGNKELWSLLNEKFGKKLVDARIKERRISGS